jgi:hypothetical protein
MNTRSTPHRGTGYMNNKNRLKFTSKNNQFFEVRPIIKAVKRIWVTLPIAKRRVFC